jgi:hypothetical protein
LEYLKKGIERILEQKPRFHTVHTAKLYYIDLYMNDAASGGKLRPWVGKKFTMFSCLDQSGKLAGHCHK